MGKEMGNLREKLAHMKKNQWLVLVLAGILLLVIAIPVPGESEKKTQEVPKAEAEGGGEMELLEKRLERALADVEGVGRVRVMLTRKSSGRREARVQWKKRRRRPPYMPRTVTEARSPM